MPLAMVATQFLDRPGLAQKTVKSYEHTLMPLLNQYGSWPIEICDRQILTDYLNSLSHLAYTTHHRHQAIVQALFNYAVEQQHIKANPIAKLKRRKPDAQKGEHTSDQTIRYLTTDQIKHLYRAVETDCRTHTIVRLLHRSGARISEVLTLDLDAVDLEQRKFQVLGKGNKQRWCFYRAHLRSFGVYAKMLDSVYSKYHGLFKQFNRFRMGNPRTAVARGVAPEEKDPSPRMELSCHY